MYAQCMFGEIYIQYAERTYKFTELQEKKMADFGLVQLQVVKESILAKSLS